MKIDEYTNPSTIDISGYRRPYLNLKEKLTQLIVNPYSLVLFLFIIKLLFFLNSLINTLENARTQTELLYSSVEVYATNIVSFPHYMAKVSNVMIAKSIDTANKGLVKSLELMLTASENLIYFIIELSVGTYECLLTAAIDDTVISALNATEEVISVANETFISFAHLLNEGLEDLSDALNEIVDTADDTADALTHLFSESSDSSTNLTTVNSKVSSINLTISNMEDWEISSSINTQIEELKNEILNFTDVQTYTKKILDAPFAELKRQVRDNLNDTFSADDMYVPGMATLDFSQGTDSIDDLYSNLINIATTSTHIIMGLIAVAILVFIIYEYCIESKDWKRVIEASQHLNFANESYIKHSNKKKYNIEVIKAIQDRKATMIGNFVAYKILFLKNPVAINNVRWMVNYCASPFLLSVLLIGLLGVVSVICQFIILSLLSKVDFGGASSEIFENTKTEVYSAFNSSIKEWTNETNLYISDYREEVNDNCFGWVDTIATTINDTVTEFDEKMNKALDSIFKGTPLYDPIEQIVGCVIESKLKKIEKAMTWLSENAQLKLPELDPEEIMYRMTDIETSNEDNTLNDNITKFKVKAKNLINNVLEFYKMENFKLLYLSLGILGLWVLFFCIGLVMLFFKEKKYREREASHEGRVYPEKDFYNSDSTISVPFDGSSLKTISREETFQNIGIAAIMQTFRDRFLHSTHGYIRTPTESTQPKKEFEETDVNNIREEKDRSTSKDRASTTDQESTCDGTLSLIGENDVSISKAQKWFP